MKKIIATILMLLISGGVFAATIEGGVKYNTNTAREYVFSDIPQFKLDANIPYFFKRGTNIEKMVYSYDNFNNIIGITVQYKNELDKAYIYDKDKNLIYIDLYDKNTNLYPHRGYRYNMQGKLILTSLSVNKDEHFRFDYQGNLIAHSINNVIYDENGNQIGTAK
ncbi:hypothetical protein IJ732_04555 [bacterium]|nr:hypothetical protein [bacterium]